MKFDLARAMREAALLTRTQKLPEAMRAIQNALNPPRAEKSRESGQPLESALAPELVAVGAGQLRSSGVLPARPLAETIKSLRLGRLHGLPAGLRRPAAKATPVVDGAEFVARSFASSQGERDYKVYLPSRACAGLPLVVMLHGCTQTPEDFAVGTRMNALAEEIGLVVAYPSQSNAANQSRCWNWFQSRDIVRGGGEASIIAGITQHIVEEYALDRERVFVAGMSAGGAMAAVMAAEYPEVYAAVGVHSGLPAGAATDVISAFAAMRGEHDSMPSTSQSRRVRTISFHGSADATVHPSNAERTGKLALRDGDVRESTSGTNGGRRVTRTIGRGPDGIVWLEQWLVASAGHAWSGGDPAGSYTDSVGPDASREMVRYFLEVPSQS